MQSNDPPSADAAVATSQPYTVGDQIILDGTGSSDPNGDNLQFSWSLSTPPQSSATLQDTGTSEPTFTPDVAGEYSASLEVSDGNAQNTDQVSVTVQSGGSDPASAELSANVTSDRTLSADTNYVVTTNVCVQNGSTLTIEAGTEMEFASNANVSVNSNDAALIAAGESSDDQKIRMTSTPGNDQAGFWEGVGINSSNSNNELSNVVIQYAGGGDYSGSIRISPDGILSLQNSEIKDSGNHGVKCHKDPPTNSQGTLNGSGNTYQNIAGENVKDCQ